MEKTCTNAHLRGLFNQTLQHYKWGEWSEWRNRRNIHTNFRFFLRINLLWRFEAGDTYLLTGIRTAAIPYKYKYSHIITYPKPYGPYFVSKFDIPYVCLYHMYIPAVHSCLNELYNIHGDTHAIFKVNVQSEQEPYPSNGDTFDMNRLRIIQTTIRTIQYHLDKTYRNPEQSEKLPFRYTNRRINHFSLHFLITCKIAYALTRDI